MNFRKNSGRRRWKICYKKAKPGLFSFIFLKSLQIIQMVPLCALVWGCAKVQRCILWRGAYCAKVHIGERHAVIGKENCKAWTAAEASLRVQKAKRSNFRAEANTNESIWNNGTISGQKQGKWENMKYNIGNDAVRILVCNLCSCRCFGKDSAF